MKTIELACSHNQGRSPLAEAFGKKHYASRGITGYAITSSGTHVNEINGKLDGTRPIDPMEAQWVLQKGLDRGLVSAEYRSLAEGELAGDRLRLAQGVARQLYQRFVAEEHEYRADAFKRFNLGQPKEVHDQTIVRPEVTLFLGMGKSNVERARRIYAHSDVEPHFATLAGFADNTPGKEFESAFGGGLRGYLAMAEAIRAHTQKALDNAVQLL